MGTTSYDGDVIAWSREQADLLRAGKFSQLDIEHLADEIEDVGKSEQRELASRMVVLLTQLLKWHHQPDRRGHSWLDTIEGQRKAIVRRVVRTPSLKATLRDADWRDDAWEDARLTAIAETGLDGSHFPETCPWRQEDVLSAGWLPGE